MSDSAVLLQHMIGVAGPDGSFGQNLHVAAATIGCRVEDVSAAMQELVEDGKVEATHAGGDPARIAGTSWRVVDMPSADPGSADDLDEMGVKELRAFADANAIDLEDATRKADVRAAIDLALEERDA